MAVAWTRSAYLALKDVYDNYWERAGESVAVKIVTAILEKSRILETYPEIGQQEDGLKVLGKEHRYLLEYGHKIIYYNHGADSYITDVFPTQMDPGKLPGRNSDQ